MNPTTRNRLIAVFALVLAGGALAFIAWGNMGENLVYYWSPAELLAQGEKAYGPTIRLGGMVKQGSIHPDDGKAGVTFKVANGLAPEAPSVTVHASQIPPQMFREGIGVIVEGTFNRNQVFETERIMVNHSNEYRPPDGGQHMGSDWKKSAESLDAPKDNP